MDNANLERARRIKVIVLDIDGVMTDGRIIYSVYGDELKFFDVQDGMGISLIHRAGIKSAIITAKKSRIVKMRSKDLRITLTYQGYIDKTIPFRKILRRMRLSPEQVCFIGDDIIDIPVLKQCGLAIGVPNAAPEVLNCVHMVTTKPGGRGAVREVCDMVLKAQGLWEKVAGRFVA